MARQISTEGVTQADIDNLRAKRARVQADISYINAVRNIDRTGITDDLRDIGQRVIDDLTALRALRLVQRDKIDEVIAKCLADGRGV